MLSRTGHTANMTTEDASALARNTYPPSTLRLTDFEFRSSMLLSKGGLRQKVTLFKSICSEMGSLPGLPSLPGELPTLIGSKTQLCIHSHSCSCQCAQTHAFIGFLERGQDVVGPHSM